MSNQRWMDEQAEGLLRASGVLTKCETKSGQHGEMKHNGRCEYCSADLLQPAPEGTAANE